MADNDYPRAATHFEEASYAAYYFTDVRGMPDLGVMEEAFRYGALNICWPTAKESSRH